MKRRAMAGLLAMTMAATMFAGCGITAADSQTADAQGSAGTATEAAKTEKPTRSRRVKKEAAEEVPAEKQKRGRPRKVKEQEPEVTPKKEAAEVPAEKPKRGRPRKKPVEAAAPEK
mgnify:CR=1 FL=1